MKILLDAQWQFHRDDVSEGHSSELDDSGWRSIDLPHDWSVEQPFSPDHASGTGYLPGGIGWYRKTFSLPDLGPNEEVVVEFDGVYRNSDVWINGHHLGHRPCGYSSFRYRLTPHWLHDQANTLAVRVARENGADSRWYPGTGIYRHVWLTRTGPIHVAPWGVFVTTPRVHDDYADVHVSIDVTNRSSAPRPLRVVTEIQDPNGQVISSDASVEESAPGSSLTAAHWHVAPHPARWSPESPTVYAVVTRIMVGGECVDENAVRFGIRSFHFDANRGFFLNGRQTVLRGVCMHHDAGMVGAAVPDPVLERRLRRVKALGANAVRCSHNPMAPEFYDLCDQLGLLVMDEAFDEWELGKRKWKDGRNVGHANRYGYAAAFAAWCERDCADMVRRDRNHPCIILWSIGNEIDYPGDPYVHPDFFDPGAPPADADAPRLSRLSAVAPRLIAAVKRHDPTRPVTMALSNLPAANAIGLPQMLDVVGYNYQEQLYQEDHDTFPGRVILGAENGRGPGPWQAVTDHAFVGGQFIWVGFDFLGEAGPWPNHASQAGLFDTRGFRKPAGWLQQALWQEEPLVRLFVLETGTDSPNDLAVAPHPRRWFASAPAPVRVAVVSNCDDVELILNGQTVASGKPGRERWFGVDLAFQPGRLEAIGHRRAHADVRDHLISTGPAHRITCTILDQGRTPGNQDVTHIEIRTVDQAGRLVTDAGIEISASIEGPGQLLGLDNGDTDDTTSLQASSRRMKDGRLLALVERPHKSGETVLAVSGKDVLSTGIRIQTDRPGSPAGKPKTAPPEPPPSPGTFGLRPGG